MLNNIASMLGAAAPLATDYESIATTIVGAGGQAAIEFTGISSSYTHLQIRGITRSSSIADNTVIQFNGDTANNYATHYVIGTGANPVTSGAEINRARFYVDVVATNASGAMWSADVIDILDYSNTNKNKTVRSLAGQDLNGSGTVWLASGLWRSTTAVSSIKLFLNGGANFAQYSSFALYGIK